MRAFWIVVLGLGCNMSGTNMVSAAEANFTKPELEKFCDEKGGAYSPDDGTGAYTCMIGDGGTKTIHISCFEGKCGIGRKSNATFSGSATISTKQGPTISSGHVRDVSGAASTSIKQRSTAAAVNAGIAAGAAHATIAASPLKQAGSNAATASTAMAVSPSKPIKSNAVTAASPNLGAAFMSSGRTTFRPQ